ncbi:MAG: hypothetical protein JO288_00945 [Hyphomicrobiales bacterium]|nr:hypothetical protein [Hyphomicrobiales bacterium]
MTDTDQTTLVGRWLLANKAGKYTKTFFDKGYKELRDIPENAIAEIVRDEPALAKKLAESLEKLTDNEPEPVSGDPAPAIPKLPPRTKLDLSRDRVSAPNIPEFTIPGYLCLSASTTAITHPENLSQVDWMIIARRTGILYAYTMGTVPGDDDPPQAELAALDWMIPDGINFLKSMVEGGSVETAITYTAGTASYVRAGVDKQEASIGFPFASASVAREHEERHASSSYKKQLQLIGRWYFPRAKLILRYCTAASDRFINAVRDALDAYDKQSNLKPLMDVFRLYGTAVPKEIILGGQMIMVHREDYQGSVNEDEVKNVIEAAVSVKTGKGQGSAGVSFQNGTGSTVTADQVSKSTKFIPRGGDTTKTTAPESWPDTVKPASEWAVIGRSGMTTILDFLPDDLRARAMAIWPKLPVPPAIWELEDTSALDHVATAERSQFVLGARTVAAKDMDGARGAVELVCGTDTTPQLGQRDAVGGRASFHRYHDGNVWIDTSSVFLPVPAGHRYAIAAPDSWAARGKAPARFAIAETNLTFDTWRRLHVPQFQAQTDGFVFCTLEASNEGERGFAWCEVDKTLIAATSVHYYTPKNAWIQYASFCAPYAKGSFVDVGATPTNGRVTLKVWQLPSTSQAWKFAKPEQIQVGQQFKAATDGFVNGVVRERHEGDRGILRLDCVKDPASRHPYYPLATTAVHKWSYSDRHITHGSAMAPVSKDYHVLTEMNSTSGDPLAEVYWTKVEPVI